MLKLLEGTNVNVPQKGICRDGRKWLLRDVKWNVLARGELERPLPVLSAGADAKMSCANPSAADVRMLFSTVRVR